MLDAIVTAPTVRIGLSPGRTVRRATFLGVVALAIVGVIATGPAETARSAGGADPDLLVLLRFMATVKAALALATLGVILWRLDRPVSILRFLLYVGAAAPMAAGPVVIWELVHVGLGAILLHAGLAGCLILLGRDPAVAARLSGVVARRRRDLRPRRA